MMKLHETWISRYYCASQTLSTHPKSLQLQSPINSAVPRYVTRYATNQTAAYLLSLSRHVPGPFGISLPPPANWSVRGGRFSRTRTSARVQRHPLSLFSFRCRRTTTATTTTKTLLSARTPTTTTWRLKAADWMAARFYNNNARRPLLLVRALAVGGGCRPSLGESAKKERGFWAVLPSCAVLGFGLCCRVWRVRQRRLVQAVLPGVR